VMDEDGFGWKAFAGTMILIGGRYRQDEMA
jgi:hypothetical protein